LNDWASYISEGIFELLFLTHRLTHFLRRIIGTNIINRTIYFQNISTRSWFSRCFDIIW